MAIPKKKLYSLLSGSRWSSGVRIILFPVFLYSAEDSYTELESQLILLLVPPTEVCLFQHSKYLGNKIMGLDLKWIFKIRSFFSSLSFSRSEHHHRGKDMHPQPKDWEGFRTCVYFGIFLKREFNQVPSSPQTKSGNSKCWSEGENLPFALQVQWSQSKAWH